MREFPDHKQFAFTIFDDTDLSTVENVGPVYRLLDELGLRTTKSVWPLASVPGADFNGSTLQDPEYLEFVLDLQSKGFEIGLHNVRNGGATRNEVAEGLAEFRRLLGHGPRVHANHASNRENVYWGAARFSRFGSVYRWVKSFYEPWTFEGHVAGSPYFWGDICQQQIDYVRNYVFRDINVSRINPSMPYRDPRRPFVNTWFSSCDGGNAALFCELLSEANQDRLEEERGVAIVYTHFASGFVENGRVQRPIELLLRRLSKKNGWFVPVSDLLDFLRHGRDSLDIPASELASMERKWLADRLVSIGSNVIHKLVPGLQQTSYGEPCRITSR